VTDGKLYREPSVVAYVRGKLPDDMLSDSEKLPEALDGVPVDVVTVDPATELELLAESGGALVAAFTEPTYEGIPGNPIDAEFTVEKPFVCHVGPDSGWVVLRDFLAGTRSDLTAAIYDFNATYIADTLVDSATANGFPIKLAIDNGLDASEEIPIQKRLKKLLAGNYDAEVIFCRAAGRFPSAYHEKVAVRDSEAFWLSSGNWTRSSQPQIDPVGDPSTASGMYSKGNREWHVLVSDTPLAKLFASYIEHDRKQARLDASAGFAGPAVLPPDVFVSLAALMDETSAAALAAPTPVPPDVRPTHGGAFRVRPLLSPDNYAARVTELIKSAEKRLYLQYSYITWSDQAHDAKFREVLDYLGELSWRDDFDLRIIVGSRDAAEKARILAENGFNEEVIRAQGRIHNKGIVADGARVLVSSQNWSGDGFLRNRDAGVIVDDAEVADYYEKVFLSDWDNRTKPAIASRLTAFLATAGAPTPPGMVRMRWLEYYAD
jgi:hypothetical protein